MRRPSQNRLKVVVETPACSAQSSSSFFQPLSFLEASTDLSPYADTWREAAIFMYCVARFQLSIFSLI
jgi:hypothetical protein